MLDKPDVIIVGAGPVGLTLANLLGGEGIATLLIERNPGTVPEPRAIALDGESLRTLQAAGLADVVLPTLREGFIADYVNGAGEHLFSTDLHPKPYGFCLQNSFDQPTLERQLLAGLDRFSCVEVRFSSTVTAMEQNDDGVSVSVEGADGASSTVSAAYLVGCDGGRSTVREQLGVAMVGDRLPQRWLVIDTVDRHLTGDPQCRFFCDPARPAMTMLRPGNERRWEWMLLDHESDEDMLGDAVIDGLLSEHTDPGAVEVYRKVVYGFSAVVAERFRDGRIFLAGDAAHMTPPFAGQGLNAGVRDVRNLSWKLVSVLRQGLPDSILDSYNEERHDAAQELVNLAVMLGEQIQPTDPAAAAERDGFFKALNEDPKAAEQFGLDLMAPLHDVRLSQGWFAEDGYGGRFLPQPEGESGRLLDDTLGSGFIALVPQGASIPPTISDHPLWQRLAPQVHGLPLELATFCDDSGRLLLVRPDHFVLASLSLGDPSIDVLDKLGSPLGLSGKSLAA